MFSGSFVALVTPFKKGLVDYPKLRELVEFQIANGSNGIVICATTGEAPTLSQEEKIRIIKETVRQTKGRVPLIVYSGFNDTKHTIQFTRAVSRFKINGALVVVPYYNKPSQEGMYQHFKAVAEAVKLPIILYNVPSRTVVSINPETIARLSRIKNIVAIKQAISNFEELSQLRLLSDITILSGEDSLTYPMLALGAKGVISVAANIIPREMALMVKKYQQGLIDEARELHYRIFPLVRAIFLESNPVPVKTAMKLLGRLNGEVRLPLVAMSPENQKKLKAVLQKYKQLV